MNNVEGSAASIAAGVRGNEGTEKWGDFRSVGFISRFYDTYGGGHMVR
jgi:hypothetical protein